MEDVCTPRVADLALPGVMKSRLLSRGYHTSTDIRSVTPAQLARDCAISASEAQRVVSVSSRACLPPPLLAGARTALELLGDERYERPIITFCKDLDDVLNGGIRRQQLTEVCGVPGAGKTQLAMQLSLNVQIPTELGGVGGQALYVDTEGSFSTDRVEQMARALSAHLVSAAERSGSADELAAARRTTPEAMLDGVHVSRVHSHREQLALARALPSFLDAHPLVRLVVIDSIAFHFRHGFDDYAARTRTLLAHALVLLRVAVQRDLAVVVINQVTTKLAQNGGGGIGGGGEEVDSSVIAPALGETWAHVANTRLQLAKGTVRGELERSALIDKSATTARISVPFRVTADGVRSVRRRVKRSLDDAEARAPYATVTNDDGRGGERAR
ncbi:P-loop containing nucleoside triphosphate hydrolase protein [Pavlovales sp. CCMP2436]|nr:P-loop containing nucleoside triphosphate hydrolase protein [Pavlovales sp. CCMP2436]